MPVWRIFFYLYSVAWAFICFGTTTSIERENKIVSALKQGVVDIPIFTLLRKQGGNVFQVIIWRWFSPIKLYVFKTATMLFNYFIVALFGFGVKRTSSILKIYVLYNNKGHIFLRLYLFQQCYLRRKYNCC